jgi:hypothetical protein
VSARAVVWAEDSDGADQKALVYSYDFSSRRRRRVLGTSAGFDATPVVVGPNAYWLSIASTTAVVACDLTSGRQRVLASGSGLGPFPVLADGSFVVWSHQERPLAPFTLTVLDTADNTTTDLALPGQTSGAIFDTPVLADDTLAWLRTDKQSAAATISTYDLRTLVARQVATGRDLVGPAFDGATVVWAQPAAEGGGDVVMGLRLAAGPAFRIARVPAGVVSVMVGGDRVAWWVGTGPRPWIGVSRLP